MVDFRYHLVSIIAVFLALAIGIVIGTTALNGALLDNLKGSISTLSTDKRGLESTINGLRQQTSSDEQLADRIGAAAVAGRLAGTRVVLVDAPNVSPGTSEGLVPLLEAAGATVTGTVRLRPDLLDPTKATVVDAVVARVAPAGLDLSGSEPVERAATELAAALIRPADGVGIASGEAEVVLSGLQDQDLVDLTSTVQPRADLAVVVTGDPVSSTDPTVPDARARALLSFAAALDAAGAGAVVAGPLTATADGGAVKALRQDGGLSERVSSVDGADRPPGRIAVVYALREQQQGGSGRYGSGPGSQAAVPSLPTGK